jgi:NAD(P)-dependent dehydrogenase (short-subunit alcohol dehydrogenase family)
MAVALDLRDRRLLVLGGSSGVGRAVGHMASRAGARVAFAARRRDRIEEAAREAPGEAIAVTCDVQDEGDCARTVADTVAAFGGLDGFVYATGMSPLVMLDEADGDEWRSVFDVNVVGASLVTRAAVPHLRESHGRAVYISSYSIRQPLPGLGLYRVSKVALDALIECWRMEHPDVEFTRVVVGNTEGTEFAASWGADRTRAATRVWVERNLFPAATMMPLDVLAESVLAVFAVRGYLDDIAVMPRAVDLIPDM